ncbi:hypothetical protein HN695_01745 [Candidatus Woesearchaeota archaeon]|nr:hypothetical protein [Candidatus Woesearchaeota archaeon]MBT5273123.1 hypothetical protein [Candidatus Woesearchaeota archaeon]MBT6040610.1 hypothetical protein [Candidatus Woesearchaeota archaeon]MBT6337562.1 hypothetical protein [Candidatus Woesearchaeota archaeon]MBT7927037.1 hypothetical protein [Candidatus Woesearchaeota archaeon]
MILENMGVSIDTAFRGLLAGFWTAIPGILAAAIILLVGYLVGWIVYRVLDKLFGKIKFDEYLIKKTGLKKSVGDLKLGHLLAVISKWFIFVLFLPQAANLIELNTLSEFLIQLSYWIPSLIAALLIVLFGIFAASYVGDKIEHIKMKSAQLIAQVTRIVIMVMIVLVALENVGLKLDIIQNTFLIIIGGIMFGFALAIGLAYGLGMKDSAKKNMNTWKKFF